MSNIPFEAIKDITPFDPYEESKARKPRVEDLTVALQEPPEVVTEMLDAPQRAKQTVGSPVEQALAAKYGEQADPVTAANALQDAFAKQQTVDGSEDFYIESAAAATDPGFNAVSQKFLTNQQIAYEVISEKFQSTKDEGFWKRVGDFGEEFIRYFPVGLYEDVTGENEAESAELAVAAATMEPDEFKKFVEDYADTKASEGVFTEENYFRYMDALSEVQMSGEDPNKEIFQLLALFDVATLGVSAAARVGIGNALRSSSAITRVGAVRGSQAATDVAETFSRSSLRDNPLIQNDTLPNAFSPRDSQAIGPIAGRVAQIASENTLVREIQFMYRSGAFGRLATPEQIDKAASKVKDSVESLTSRSTANVDVIDITGLGEHTAVLDFGRATDGAPFTTKGNATKYVNQLKDKGVSAHVIEAPEGGFHVRVAERLKLANVADPLDHLKDVQGVSSETLNTIFGSTRNVDDWTSNTLANMAEGGNAAIQEAVTPYIKTINSVPLESKSTLGKILKDLRDGPDSHIRDWYSEMDFIRKFKDYHPKGKAPTEKDLDAFYALKTMSDAAYMLAANRTITRFAENGFKTLNVIGSGPVAARIVKEIPENASILDGTNGAVVRLDDFPEGTTVWKVDQELDGGIEYIAKPKGVREVQAEDVLGYNAGGNRAYQDANYFVTVGDNAILTTFSEQQAKTAKVQISKITAIINSTGKNIDDLVDELDEVIPANNDWNPSIESTADFVKWTKENKWNLKVGDVNYKAKDKPLEGSSMFAGMRMGDYIATRRARSNNVLAAYGGDKATTLNPIQSVVNQLSNQSSSFAFKAYNYRSKVSWLKAAGYNKQLEQGADPQALFGKAFAEVDNIGGARGRYLRKTGGIIQRRDGVNDKVSQTFSDFGEKMQEYVFEKTGIKSNFKDPNVTGVLLNLGFRSAFGFLNTSQFILQASHIAVMSAISPIHGTKGAAMSVPFRAMMHLKEGPAKVAAREKLSTFTGLSIEDLNELEIYLRTSGRRLVEADAIEKGTGGGFGYSAFEGKDLKASTARKALSATAKVAGKADQVGLVAFNEGERLTRYAAVVTSFLEYKAKYRGASALSDSGRMQIARREQDLSFNMTNSSRGMWQTGMMKVPTQWLSYSMRALESITVGRQFTKMEKARIGLAYLALGGASGYGIGHVADTIGEQFGVEPDSSVYVGLKHGFTDFVLSELISGVSGEEVRTAFGSRLAPFTAFTDMWSKLRDENFWAALGGPSGEIVGGGAAALMGALGNIADGNYSSTMVDLERVLRTPSGIDNQIKARQIINHGTYTSKSGSPMPVDMQFSKTEAMMQAAGITNFRATEYYAKKSELYSQDKKFNAIRKELDNDFQKALRMWDSDRESATKLMDEVSARIELADLSPVQKMRLRRGLLNDNNPDLSELIIRQLQEGNDYAASVIETMR